ncbi:antimicrobial peptide system protein, SdpB family [Lentzea xinjiangensis]|uniref:Antimicrobial peptide system protein, SdpB family n=1 Tax=Lentzea xinjiangensis TaxID=402600 RepID=A0A1H9IZU0_9PSEU|nr:sporulation-delaying protein SdpB family protein [Lentzea xinjiangensis]SEQ80052.1 antimicrobial peptide system protein, SdpB family [Lentzea xinjiangensis]
MRSAVARALAFDPRTTAFGAARTLVALAELSVLVFTSDADLFPAVPNTPAGPRCDGLRTLSLWCAGSSPTAHTVFRAVTIAVLVLAASGYRPRWTCIPQWYATFSLAAAMHIPNGGENVARTVTLLLIPLCLGDDRIWHWRRPATPLPAWWRGTTFVTHLVIRLQVAIVYGQAVWIKVVEPEWRNGTAMHHVIQDAYFGAVPELVPLLGSGFLIPAFTWGTVVLETAIAICVFGNPRLRRAALAFAVVLHGGIIVVLGLASFGLVMIGFVALASCGRSLPDSSLPDSSSSGSVLPASPAPARPDQPARPR